jgi:hypothetical protein
VPPKKNTRFESGQKGPARRGSAVHQGGVRVTERRGVGDGQMGRSVLVILVALAVMVQTGQSAELESLTDPHRLLGDKV